jgi:hypothetical protein
LWEARSGIEVSTRLANSRLLYRLSLKPTRLAGVNDKLPCPPECATMSELKPEPPGKTELEAARRLGRPLQAMARVLVVTYISTFLESSQTDLFQPLAEGFRDDLKAGVWPYDVGDDPSFCSARRTRGQVTWGVCRQDVRSQLQPGDVVIFFVVQYAANRIDSSYRFAAALSVQTSITEDKVFHATPYTTFGQYLNLLIRPCRSGWEHLEPSLPRRYWHDDWLWRISKHNGQRKAAFMQAGLAHVPGQPLIVGGRPVQLAPNYVIFSSSPSESFVAETPPLVAQWSREEPFEKWRDTPKANAIRTIAFTRLGRNNLRTRNRQQTHRHVWVATSMSGCEVVAGLKAAVASAD